MDFYAPQDPIFIKKQRQLARDLKSSQWWKSKLQAGICYYCESKFSSEDLTMDHKVPISRGGLSSKNNIVVSCKSCNSQKQSKNLVDFIKEKKL